MGMIQSGSKSGHRSGIVREWVWGSRSKPWFEETQFIYKQWLSGYMLEVLVNILSQLSIFSVKKGSNISSRVGKKVLKVEEKGKIYSMLV